MKKIYLCLCATLLVLVTLLAPSTAHAADSNFHQELAHLVSQQDSSGYFDIMELTIGSNILTLDGDQQMLDAAPRISNNRTMLPIRAVAEAAGAEVDYDSATSTVIITSAYGDEIHCTVGASSMTVNAASHSLDSPSYIENGRTYLPVRAVAEALDLKVGWSQATSTVTISAPYQTARVLVWDDQPDLEGLGANQILYDGDGLWILQFDTPTEARAAELLLESQGVTAEPDLYIPPVDIEENDQLSSASHSWGVSTSHFDDFTKRYAAQLTKSGAVAVVDTGVDDSHSFLKGRVLNGRDFVDGDNDADDGHYHGTHVAGTIIDCVGEVPVKILPVRVLDRNGSGYTSGVASGIKYAADQGASVINLSLGGSRSSGSSDSLDAAIDHALSKGALVVVAAGNDNSDTTRYCPAHLTSPGVVVVSAGDSAKKKAHFSNYGDSVDLMAPGVNVKASTPGNSYKTLNGTSMAAPHTAAAGILLDLLWDETLTPAQLEETVHTATSNGKWTDKYMGCGFLDMSKAKVPALNPPPAPSPSPVPTVTGYQYNVSSLTLTEGETTSLKLTALYSDGSTKDVTSSAGLYSTNTSVASITSGGTVKGLKTGTAQISMSAAPSGVAIPTPVAVNVKPAPVEEPDPPKVVSYRYSVSNLNLTEGKTASLKVTAIYSDGSTRDITTSAGLYSTNTSVASIASDGTVTGLKAGTAQISMSAAPSGVSIPAPVTVTVKATPVNQPDGNTYKRLFWGIANTGDTSTSLTLSVGATLQVDLYGETSDGRIVNLTKECTPYSSDSEVVTVTASGKLTAVGKGYTYLWLKSAPNDGLLLPPLLEIMVE